MATTERPEPTPKDIGPKNPAVQAGMGVVDYVDDRTSVTTGAKWFMFRNVPRGTSWFQTLGFTAMAVFGMQAITGIMLAMFYKPETTTAHAQHRPHHQRRDVGLARAGNAQVGRQRDDRHRVPPHGTRVHLGRLQVPA